MCDHLLEHQSSDTIEHQSYRRCFGSKQKGLPALWLSPAHQRMALRKIPSSNPHVIQGAQPQPPYRIKTTLIAVRIHLTQAQQKLFIC
jgi:hypothetical protein